ncbi:proteasome activator complex subunit 4 [Anoplophora glabripennis]|uniref:proteasome activator complex subunit 4 n=1 Tax=Anoplophora glabripennis TaxID=217634 RepID=UPI000874A755|nr:proteasome activator complex subunit 4 [Anoplophora glabripennis]
MDKDIEKTRFEKLGFNPQKENIYNKLLPYAEELDEESKKLFTDIKTNLVKAVLAREMRPGCALWTSRLNKYIKIYGMKFSKEDHIALIKLFYELVTIPDLEPTRINKCATTLIQLLKKKYLLTRDELQLEWRPLYNLCVRVMEKSKTDIGMYRYFSTFEHTIFHVIRASKVYFPASATQEILDEFRPRLCPFNVSDISNTIQYLELFLPYSMKPEEADISYKLWFEEFMTFWDVCHNACAWENHMMWIMTSIARFQIGYIDWEPYVPTMFVRFQRTLQLPVTFKQRQLGKQHKIDTSAMAIWIICALNGNNNTAFFHFEKLMQSLESYYHPANTGRWTPKLRELLRQLSYYFIQRVHCERYKTPSWEFHVPDHYKLTDENIDKFVNILKPCIEQAMFSRMGSQDTSLALQYLASLRPNIIIPMTLDKLYSSMYSLTEPHKLTSSMMGVIAVGRYMVQGSRNNFPEGPTHVIPLLMELLPGIDPNDIRKSYVTFNFIVHFVNMIPLINSSEASNYHNLTEEEHVICEATAGLEDFVLQFFDRICTWVESSSLDFVRLEQMTNNHNVKNRAETISESALGTVVAVVLNQCSPDIFKSALKKMYNFVTNKIMEVQVSGKMLAVCCHCFARVNPKETLKLFIPYLCDTIEQLLNENPNIAKEEHIGDEFLYNLLILSELTDGRSELIHYMDRLTKVLDKTLHMACLSASQLASRMLDIIMASLTSIQPTEVRSSSFDYSTHVKDFLPVREWGKAQNIKDIKISWYVPGKQEVNEVQKLLNKYLVPELNKLDSYSSGELTLTRQELKQTLKIIISILSCQPLLPVWEEPVFPLVESVLDPWAFNLVVSGSDKVTMPDGSRNVRKVIVDTLHRVQKKLLELDEGDTQSIQNIVNIYNIVLFNKTRGQDFEFHWKSFHMAKKLLEDRLHQKKLHLRHVLIDRVMLQQEFRIESRNCSFTETHKQILLDLFELSVSRYSEMRIAAQSKLFAVVSYFPYSYTVLTEKIKEILQLDSEKNHEKFKGCLYVLLGPKSSPIVARHDWLFIRQMWPLIVKSMPSEKPSIINLISSVTEAVHKYFPTIAIKLIIPESTLATAYNLNSNVPICDLSNFRHVIDKGEEYLQKKSELRRLAYEGTLNDLLDAAEAGNLHWRYHSMTLNFIKDLVHFDVNYNSRIVKFFLKASINESLTIRKTAMRVLVFIMIQNKPKFEKIEIDPYKYSTSPTERKQLKPGIRDDNKWLLYNSKTLPKNAEAWDEPRFIHDQFTGYYNWPKKLEVYNSPSKQTSAAKRMNNLSDTETEIYSFFRNESNIEKLIKYLSLEEKKGHDQFNAYRFLTFKNLFKIFEDELLPIFLPYIEKLVQDKLESNQRCAAEIISALIRGSKHWEYKKVEKLWAVLIPILETAIVNMCSETQTDWALCITMGIESRDPNKCHWLLEFLLNDPLKDPTSFIACSRLHLLCIAINQQSWRNSEICNRLLDYFKPHLSHPFQNIREKISSCLTIMLSKDIHFPEGNETDGPRTQEFLKEVLPKLNKLYNSSLAKLSNENGELNKTCDIISLDCEEEKESVIRLFKIVAKFVTTNMVRVNFSAKPEFFELLPLAALLQNNEIDEELANIATNLLVVLAQTMTIEKYIPCAIGAIRKVANCPSWSARALIAEFLPIFVFYNMATINAEKSWVLEIQAIVLELLEDVQPEVRMGAAKVLNGLLHCQFIPEPTNLLELFKQKALTKLKHKNQVRNKEDGVTNNNNNMRTRHAGVLGLCAFINSHPYDVPDFLPDVFEQLRPHLSDPQPIPATIRKTLGDFKRTHHDNWETHKLKFTEEELSLLSDLTVPPSYYV